MRLSREEIERRCEESFSGWSPLPENQRDHIASLFWENRFMCHSLERGYTPIYNLTTRDDQSNGTLSVYLLFMQCATEYEAALVIMGSLTSWTDMCEKTWFKPLIERWRIEMNLRDIAIGKGALIKQASGGNAAAGKSLIEVSKSALPRRLRDTNVPPAVGNSQVDVVGDDILSHAEQLKSSVKGSIH